MKKLLFVFVIGAFTACGGNEGVSSVGDSQATKIDTLTPGNGAAMKTDTTGASSMNADTTGMSNAR